jgi:WD40 repeat protein
MKGNNNENEKKTKDYKSYIHYKISPKNCIIDFCLKQKMYFFVGRNIDNSIKVYEVEMTKEKKPKQLKYNIPTDSFVSCLYKKDKKLFFTGHKSGKLYEWEIKFTEDKNIENNSIKKIEIKRDLMAHKDSMICCINYIEKHNIIITSSNDGKICIRKYFDFELLSSFETGQSNSIATKIIYTDYDLLYILINCQNKSRINVYTLNGLLIEYSSNNYLIDIEPLKNGKVIYNDVNSSKLKIFGLNNKLGTFNDYDILSKSDIKKRKITNLIFQPKHNCFYFILDNKTLYRQQIQEFENIYKGVDKLIDAFNPVDSQKNQLKESKESKVEKEIEVK